MEKPLQDSSPSSKTISLSNWQSEVFDNDARYKVINCGRRAGKSTISSLKLLEYATENSRSISWYIAPTYKQAKGIMWEMLLDLIPPQVIEKKNETELTITLKNGSRILLKGSENPDSLRGVRIDFCVFDECAFIDKWDDVWKVVRPTLADTKADCWFISTPNGFNHFKDLMEKKDKDWRSFHFTSYDNPFIPREEIDQAKQDMNEDSFAQEWMGEFRKMSGLIYKTFNRDIHMVDVPKLDSNWTFYRSLDFGFGHKTALGYFAVNSVGSEIYMYDGLYQSGLVPSDMAQAIKIKDGGKSYSRSVADSAQPMIIEELRQLGCDFEPIEKGQDSVRTGISKVADLLKVRKDTGKPTLMFAKHLFWVADEMERYRWMETSDGAIKEVPLKREDDAEDMIRYFAMSYMRDTSGGPFSEYLDKSHYQTSRDYQLGI